jgi:type I restriction enzyme M protein
VISHDPQELLESYQQQQQDITELRNKLKGILGDALKSSVDEGE